MRRWFLRGSTRETVRTKGVFGFGISFGGGSLRARWSQPSGVTATCFGQTPKCITTSAPTNSLGTRMRLARSTIRRAAVRMRSAVSACM